VNAIIQSEHIALVVKSDPAKNLTAMDQASLQAAAIYDYLVKLESYLSAKAFDPAIEGKVEKPTFQGIRNE
jgi:hypothetical protein